MQTPEIKLRELERTDLQLLTSWRNDPELIAWLVSGFRYICPAVDEAWYEGYLQSRANNVRLAICTSEGTMVGVVYLLHINWINRSAEFGIWIGERTLQGKSYGEQATRLAVDHAFTDLDLGRLNLAVLVHNERAIGLYRKIGFQTEGIQRRAVYKQGKHHDLLLMGLLREEYVHTGA